jgi:hypothetical protein
MDPQGVAARVEQTLLAEVIALRTIAANFHLGGEGKVTSEQLHAFIERADSTESKRAKYD